MIGRLTEKIPGAYTILAHYYELEWAAEYGVVESLVRISIGLESQDWLEERMRRALGTASRVDEFHSSKLRKLSPS